MFFIITMIAESKWKEIDNLKAGEGDSELVIKISLDKSVWKAQTQFYVDFRTLSIFQPLKIGKESIL